MTVLNSRIGRWLIFRTVVFSSLIALILTGAELFQDYRQQRDDLERSIEAMQAFLEPMAASVWAFNANQVQLTLATVLRMPNIEQATVATADGEDQWSVGITHSSKTIIREYPLLHKIKGTEQQIGTFIVVGGLDHTINRISMKALAILVGNGIKTFTVSVFMLVICFKQITLPLANVSRAIRSSQEGGAEGFPETHRNDEIGDLARSAELSHRYSIEIRRLEAEKAAQAVIRDSEASLRLVIDSLPIPLVISRLLDETIVFANRYACEIFCGDEWSPIGLPARNFWAHPDDRGRLLEQSRSLGVTRGFDALLHRHDGSEFVAVLSAAIIRYGGVPALLTSVTDITEHAATEMGLRQSEQRFRLAMEMSATVAFTMDRELTYTWAHSLQAGFDTKALIGRTVYDIFVRETADRLTALYRRVLETGGRIRQDVQVQRLAPPSSQVFDLIVEPLRDLTGEIIGLAAAATDITERKMTEERLILAKAEAEQAVLARSKFLASASHDIRQPVQSLLLLIGVLRSRANAPEVIEVVGVMESAIDGLNSLLSSILELSRLDAGVITPHLEALDIGSLLDRLSQEYGPLAQAKGLRLKAVPRTLYARTDAFLLERLVRNLIENAIRYTNDGAILLGVRRCGNRVRIDVVDTGIGISSDHLPHIFEEFYQVGNSARDRKLGLGLGLSIVGRLACLLGAELLVKSREGHGTGFTLLLPQRHTTVEQAAIVSVPEVESGRILTIESDA
jgi:PAS domain S-box-containing protein